MGRKYSDNSNELLFNIIEEYDDAEKAEENSAIYSCHK